MSLSPQIRKHIYPALKRLGFEKFDFIWHLEGDSNWLTQVEVRSSKHGDDGLYYFELCIGFFSRELDDLMGFLRQAGFDEHSRKHLPVGVGRCHFQTSLFNLDSNGVWSGYSKGVFLPKGKACEADIMVFARKLETIIPLAFERYASDESLIRCKREKLGNFHQSKQSSMYAAAACVKLLRFDEARAFLNEAVRPGSIQFMKDIGGRLEALIARNTDLS